MTGIILIDKEPDWTSHDAVAKLRRVACERRIGHSGTLDPMATGLLVAFLGRATRAVEFAEADWKEYRAALRLGLTTDTEDVTGETLTVCDTPVSPQELEGVLPRFLGEQEQIPPMYSAIKVNGKKLCDIARRGGEVERSPRRICIERLTCLGQEGGDMVLDVRCSKGTYIRTLCADIGAALGVGGCMAALRRTRAGAFSVEDAHTLAELEREGPERFLLPTDRLFADYPAATAEQAEEKRIRVGADYPCRLPKGSYRVYSAAGEFLMLGRCDGDSMTVIKSFFEV
jgi:tRNA pseudouridine55 synthase